MGVVAPEKTRKNSSKLEFSCMHKRILYIHPGEVRDRDRDRGRQVGSICLYRVYVHMYCFYVLCNTYVLFL
jgi:hypothetical protein